MHSAEGKTPLTAVYQGWDGYQLSLVRAITPRISEELAFRLAPDLPD
jgi:hypothetical protein